MKPLSENVRRTLLQFQRNEVSEACIYEALAKRVRSSSDREVLLSIASEERAHYKVWKSYTGQEVSSDRGRVWRMVLLARVFGYTFALRMMEAGEEGAQVAYHEMAQEVPEALRVEEDEDRHEQELLDMLDEERMQYMGSVVLGLNDALVELTGALAGLTLALRNTPLIALTGLITGIAAALSMAASEYLSTKAEEQVNRHPVRAAIYTGIAYVCTVAILIAPYLILHNYIACLVLTLCLAVCIIAAFNFYISVAQNKPFRHRFIEMAGLSLGVAGFSFLVGYLLRHFFNIEI